MKIRLVEDWKELHKKSSVRLAGAMTALTAVGPALIEGWHSIPDDLKAVVPHGLQQLIAIGIFLLFAVLRYTKYENDKVQP